MADRVVEATDRGVFRGLFSRPVRSARSHVSLTGKILVATVMRK